MSSFIVQHSFHDFQIPQRETDGHVSLTKMAAAYPAKKISHFLANGGTKEFLDALSSNAGIPALELLSSTVGGDHGGTWAHPQVAVKFAAWLSPEFEVWATGTLLQVLTGTLPPMQPVEPLKQIGPSVEERLLMLVKSM